MIGYFILNEYDFKDLLFNDITLLCYPITESENYPLVGSYLPSHSPEENDNDYCISFYTIDYELSFEDVLFDRKNLNKFLKLGKLDKQTNNEIETLKKQLQQANGEIDRLKAELEQAQALLAEKQNIELVKDIKPKSYITPELQIIDDVIAEFWENHTDDKIPVKKDVIVDWIIEKYNISNNIASAIDSITRPEYARTGGLKALSKRLKD